VGLAPPEWWAEAHPTELGIACRDRGFPVLAAKQKKLKNFCFLLDIAYYV
jgi:hypothetical protein